MSASKGNFTGRFNILTIKHVWKLHISQGLYSLSGKTSYRKISWSLEAARFGFKLFQSLWNLAGTSAALLPRCLSNFRAIRPLQHPISWLRDFTRFGGKTSSRLVNRGPGLISLSPCISGYQVTYDQLEKTVTDTRTKRGSKAGSWFKYLKCISAEENIDEYCG